MWILLCLISSHVHYPKKFFIPPPPAEKDGRRSKTFPSRESSYLIHGAVELAIGTVQIAILALVPGVVRAFHS